MYGCDYGDDTQQIPKDTFAEFGVWPFKKKKRKKGKKKKKSFLSKALGTAGAVVTAPVRVVAKPKGTIKKLGRKIEKVPIVGESVSVTYDYGTEPIKFASDVVKKKGRVDKAVYESAKRHVKMGKKAAPSAQIAAQFIPGVGNVASGAIGIGHALSKGRSIKASMAHGVKMAIPGAPIVQASYNLVSDVKKKKKPSKIQLDTLSRAGQNVDVVALGGSASAAIDGDVSAMAELNAELDKMPTSSKKAAAAGIALAAGEYYQGLHRSGAGSAGSIGMLRKKGVLYVKSDPVLSEIFRHPTTQANVIGLVGSVKFGFLVGLGAESYKQTEASLTSLKEKLEKTKGEQAVIGLYLAIAYHIGKTSREPLEEATALQQFGYRVADGISESDLDDNRKQQILALIGNSPEALDAASAVAKDESWWERFLEWLGL